jgi:hypothetical protein
MGKSLQAPARQAGTVNVDVDPELLSHEKHLPETIECSCGYKRPNPFKANGEDVR